MILTDKSIKEKLNNRSIVIEPFDEKLLGPNSYDIHLSKNLATYSELILDAKAHNTLNHFEIPEDGYLLHQGRLYLGSTEEYTEANDTFRL